MQQGREKSQELQKRVTCYICKLCLRQAPIEAVLTEHDSTLHYAQLIISHTIWHLFHVQRGLQVPVNAQGLV